jgi:hypothetical protein
MEKGIIFSTGKGFNFSYKKEDGAWRAVEPRGASKLDEKSLRDLMSRLDWYHDHKEMNSYMIYFAPDWSGTFTDPDGKPVTLDRMKFLNTEYNTLNQAKSYHHEREITRIAVADDGASAEIDSTEREKVEIGGKSFDMKETSKDNFAWRDGSIFLVKSVSEPTK